MPHPPIEKIPKHPDALKAINQASIALKIYRKDGAIPHGHPRILPPLDQLIANLDRAYKDLLDCQERILFH